MSLFTRCNWPFGHDYHFDIELVKSPKLTTIAKLYRRCWSCKKTEFVQCLGKIEP